MYLIPVYFYHGDVLTKHLAELITCLFTYPSDEFIQAVPETVNTSITPITMCSQGYGWESQTAIPLLHGHVLSQLITKLATWRSPKSLGKILNMQRQDIAV